MDSRTAAHVLSQISSLLELGGEGRFKARAYETAARAINALDTDDLGSLLRSGELAKVAGIGPATLSVVKDLVETGSSNYLEMLQSEIPEGVREMMRVPGLSSAKVHLIHEELGIASVDELEEAARDGRLARLPRFGAKTAEKILKSIEFMRNAGAYVLYQQGYADAQILLSNIQKHPDVKDAEVVGSIRRLREVVRDVDIVASCSAPPSEVLESFGRAPGVKTFKKLRDTAATITFVDGLRLDLHCVAPEEFGSTLWRETGADKHVAEVAKVIGKAPEQIKAATEEDLYSLARMQHVPPELREGMGEVEAARSSNLPDLIEYSDIQGILHCHSTYSDGKATILEMAKGAQAQGWSYIGISDHSQAAFYAGGLKPDDIARQHDEIDRINSDLKGFRILKGIEADILQDGSLDYDEDTRGKFDYMIGSIHSRFKMDADAMTERVLRAMDDPRLTILSHPTGRLLLSREPYGLDIEAVLQKAAEKNVAIEVNGDPRRMDLDWRYLKRAHELGITIEIGPDAHSVAGLDNTIFGVNVARKGWIEKSKVLNARSAGDIVEFARARK